MVSGKLSWFKTAFGLQIKIILCVIPQQGGEIERRHVLEPDGYSVFDIVITDESYDTF